jgi:hypothetical protein
MSIERTVVEEAFQKAHNEVLAEVDLIKNDGNRSTGGGSYNDSLDEKMNAAIKVQLAIEKLANRLGISLKTTKPE